MLISEYVNIIASNRNYDYFTEKGYTIERYLNRDKHIRVKRGTIVTVKVSDLPENSSAKVEVKCDYCGEIIEKPYYNLLSERNKINKDCCIKCRSKKVQDTNLLLYGTTNYIELSKIKGYSIGRNLKYTKKLIIEILNGKGLILVEQLIITNNVLVTDKLPFICNNHIEKGVQYRSLDQILHSDTCCKYAGFELRTGENNNKWKGGITTENEKIRKSDEYKNWRTSVFERDNFTCQCCNDNSGRNLQAHHIENFTNNEDLRFSINNGITLCENCHNPSIIGSFHHTYGTFNNNSEQINEYIKNIKQSNSESQQDSILLCSNV